MRTCERAHTVFISHGHLDSIVVAAKTFDLRSCTDGSVLLYNGDHAFTSNEVAGMAFEVLTLATEE